jgi:hypothetical protein
LTHALLEGETRKLADTLYGRFPPPFPRPARQPGREALAQLRESLPHSLLHRLDGDLERGRDLGVLEPLLATHLKDFTAFFGQAIYRVAHRLLQLDTEDLVFRRRRARRVDCRERSLARDDPLVPNVVESSISGGPNEIGAKGLLHFQRLAAAPQLEHHLLRYLLGQCPLTKDRLCHPHEVRVVRAKHRIERTLVSGPDALLQIPLARVVRIQVGRPVQVSVLFKEGSARFRCLSY